MVSSKLWQTDYSKRVVIGMIEYIEILGPKNARKKVKARIDTGATRSSIDRDLANELGLGPVLRTKLVKQALGHMIRPIIIAEFIMGDVKMKEEFTVAKRSHMKYPVLIGRNALKNGFLIDPNLKK